MSERHEIWDVADALQMDLRAATAKLVELRARLAGLELTAEPLSPTFMNGPVLAVCCDECGCGAPLHTADCTKQELLVGKWPKPVDGNTEALHD